MFHRLVEVNENIKEENKTLLEKIEEIQQREVIICDFYGVLL